MKEKKKIHDQAPRTTLEDYGTAYTRNAEPSDPIRPSTGITQLRYEDTAAFIMPFGWAREDNFADRYLFTGAKS